MDENIELDILNVNYCKVNKIINKIGNLKAKLSYIFFKEDDIKRKILEKIQDLHVEIENSPKIKKKFRLAILLGDLYYTSGYSFKHKLIYDKGGFSIFPQTFNIINNDNFMVDINSQASFVLIDENDKILPLKKYYIDFAINLSPNDFLFISYKQMEILRKQILHLLKEFCSESFKINSSNKMKLGLYKEKLNKLFIDIDSLGNYDLGKYFLNDISLPSFNELISKPVIKLFMGEKLKVFEKIAIAKLTDSQVLKILNSYIQHNYKGLKLNNYLSNIEDINNIIGCIGFEKLINHDKHSLTDKNDTKHNQYNIVNVDFVNKKIMK